MYFMQVCLLFVVASCDVPMYPQSYNQRREELRSQMTSRLHDAINSNVHEFPFFVMINIWTSLNESNFCSGVIISGSYIATAAHCMYSSGQRINAEQIRVVGGKNSYASLASGFFPRILDYKIHPDYRHEDTPGTKKDLALIQYTWLQTTPAKTIWTPIELPNSYEYTDECFILGAGFTKLNRLGRLRYNVIASHRDLDLCCTELPGYACIGDSGSPVICTHTISESRIYKLHGIVMSADRMSDDPLCGKSIDERKTYVANLKYFDQWVRFHAFPAERT